MGTILEFRLRGTNLEEWRTDVPAPIAIKTICIVLLELEVQNEPRRTEPLDALLRIAGNENKLRKEGGTPFQYTIRMWPRMRKARAHDFRMVRARHVMIRGTREKSTTEMPKEKLQENRRNIEGCANGPRWQRWEFSLSLFLSPSLYLYCVSVKTIFNYLILRLHCVRAWARAGACTGA